jgi:hypothetical protein
MTQPVDASPRAPKKKMSGCMISVLVFLGLAACAVIAGGVGLWKVMSTPDGKKITRVMTGVMGASWRARSAPGTSELREQAGCDQAVAMDGAEMDRVMRDAQDASAVASWSFVTCQVGFLAKPPACERVAQIYAAAAHPSRGFLVSVQRMGKLQPECREAYDPGGTPVPMPSGTQPR